ncbi:flagellar biosynthesis protein FlgJ [Altererythrobacter soli]|uniref:Flagellar biosynthesis protein FlgJ n=1 Tax=Croceibacterium soli TaxID=1739690 RepID=A0A6I4URZ6_9SPHN|nr:rod-binding protein [Croceibacterium soli]MXP41561.1 flagellar biosynthesis protein FlgJ [Croceibacterium soli]
MTTPTALTAAASALPAAPAAGSDRARLAEASRQFEAIFLRQMLTAARSADFGGDDLFGGQGEETFAEMRDARFAEIASSTGAIGLAASIEAQLARFMGPEN